MKNKLIIVTSSAILLSALVFGTPALAQTKIKAKTKTTASSTLTKIQTIKTHGNTEIDKRISDLNKLLSKVQSLKKISDTDKSGITTSIQNEISTLDSLKGQIDLATSTSSATEGVKSITKEYRVYALVMPRINIIAAADRVGTIHDMLSILAGKLQSRLATATSTKNISAASTSLADMNAKIDDAKTQAQNAINRVATLIPDNGDKNVLKSNTTALKEARMEIQTANKDLVAARKDAQSIIGDLK